MRVVLITLGLLLAVIGDVHQAPVSSSGPMKISDNNIENIFNINIYINGVFSNDIQSDIVNVLVQLLNQQSTSVGGGVGGLSGQTMKDQLMDFVKKAESNDLNLNIPASSLMTPEQQNANLDGLAKKIQEALTAKPNEIPSNLDPKSKDLMDLLQKLK